MNLKNKNHLSAKRVVHVSLEELFHNKTSV